MKKGQFALIAATALAGFATPASALNIILRSTDGSFTSAPNGGAALYAFQKAANYWNQTLTNNTTLIFDIHFAALRPGVLGSTGSNSIDTRISDVYTQLNATKTSALDQIAVAGLTPLSANGGLAMRVNAPATPAGGGIDTAAATYLDNDDSYNNLYLNQNTANNRALGIGFDNADTAFAYYHDVFGEDYNADADADITFSSNFAFDFDPSDGISVGTYDFVAVAIHEMGHALGFVSGVDLYDYYGGPNGPGAADLLDFDFNDTSIGSTLDMFRYGNGFNADGSRQLQWAAGGRPAFFSIDGETPFNFDHQSEAEMASFSTGRYNGDGEQASHWKDNDAFVTANGCFIESRAIGIMDPTAAACSMGVLTSNDLAAFDAIGYNLGFDILGDRGYTFDSRQVFALGGLAIAQVPEPGTWAMLILGFGLIGAGMRRARTRARIVFA